jgi:hypothetical protein
MPTTNPQPPTHEQITERARRYYEQAGSPEGRDDEFWLQAEQDLRNESNGSNGNGEKATSKQGQSQGQGQGQGTTSKRNEPQRKG